MDIIVVESKKTAWMFNREEKQKCSGFGRYNSAL